MQKPAIAYVYSASLRLECDKLPSMPNRASIVHDLILAYKLLDPKLILTVLSQDATEDELRLFHSSDYVNFLKNVGDLNDSSEFEFEQEEYGLGYDCPVLSNIYQFVRVVAGGSLTAAKLLCSFKFRVAINWFGGWHHAQRDCAEGFCYVNDVVIAIQKLTEKFNRVLYVDLDIHHGNGVQNAFELSKRVLTLSFHKHAAGFYPGTGDLTDNGSLKGKYYSLNVPFRDGVSHPTFCRAFLGIFRRIVESYQPSVIVVQCGADGLNGDPVGECNLTLETFGVCLREILGNDLPTLVLGGGGYNFTNAARLWTYLTSVITGKDVPDEIPADSEYFMNYAPSYELQIPPGKQKDYNTTDYIDGIIKHIIQICNFIKTE